MKRLASISGIAVSAFLAACGSDPDPVQYGPNPVLPEQQRGLLPSMGVASPAGWGNERPTVPEGYTVTPIATGLKVPRQTLVLPNGDILVAEGKGGQDAPAMRPKDFVAGYVMEQGSSTTKSGDRLTLLRDADGDGTYEGRTVFAANLNAPYGLALVGDSLYVANQDALVRFDYRPGQIRASGAPVTVTALPRRSTITGPRRWRQARTAAASMSASARTAMWVSVAWRSRRTGR